MRTTAPNEIEGKTLLEYLLEGGPEVPQLTNSEKKIILHLLKTCGFSVFRKDHPMNSIIQEMNSDSLELYLSPLKNLKV
jgi:hypothetical protein